jgi:hypothetical protein
MSVGVPGTTDESSHGAPVDGDVALAARSLDVRLSARAREILEP